MEIVSALQTIGHTFLEFGWHCICMVVQAAGLALQRLMGLCLLLLFFVCSYVLFFWVMVLLIRFLGHLFYNAINIYNMVFPLRINAQVKHIQSQQLDLIRQNAHLEAELQKSLERSEDIRSGQASLSDTVGLLSAELNLKKALVEDMNGRSEKFSQENLRLRRDFTECKKQVDELICERERLQRNAKSWENHVAQLHEELVQQRVQTIESEDQVEHLQAALKKKEEFALTVAEFAQSECRMVEANSERMSRFKTMIESSCQGDQEASDDVGGFSSEEEA